jgi:hypothetical protein
MQDFTSSEVPVDFKFPLAFTFQLQTTLRVTSNGKLREERRSMQYMASDPFNDRFKLFKSDFSHNIPTNTGVVYEFNNKRVIIYNDF